MATEPTPDGITVMHQTMTALAERMEEQERIGRSIARRTENVVRGVLLLMAVVAIGIMFLIHHLTGNLRTAITSMVSMYEHFGVVQSNMNAITGKVLTMDRNVKGIPAIKEHMLSLNDTMHMMDGDVARMTGDIVIMDGNMATITQGVGKMADRFDQLIVTTRHMGYNVNQMGNTLRTGDPMNMISPPP